MNSTKSECSIAPNFHIDVLGHFFEQIVRERFSIFSLSPLIEIPMHGKKEIIYSFATFPRFNAMTKHTNVHEAVSLGEYSTERAVKKNCRKRERRCGQSAGIVQTKNLLIYEITKKKTIVRITRRPCLSQSGDLFCRRSCIDPQSRI